MKTLFSKYSRIAGHRFLAFLFLIPAPLSLLGGCRQGAEDHSRKSGAQSRKSGEPTGGESVTIETANRTVEIMAGVVGWPSGIPSEVPPFNYGTISSVTKSESPESLSWSISVTDLAPGSIRNYESELRKRAFQTSSMIVGTGGSVTGQHGLISIAVVAGSGTATISVALKK